MCLNQILFDEQIALIGHAAASDPAVVRHHRRQLAAAAQAVASYPYPHRPYYPWATTASVARHFTARVPHSFPLHTGTC